jgi:hypothetical protein
MKAGATSWRSPVRYYPPAGLSPLFCPLPKSKPRPSLDVRYTLSDDHVLRFSAREALGIPEQTLLLAILSLAGEQYSEKGRAALLQGSDGRELPETLWAKLYPGGGAGEHHSLMVETTWEQLNQRCGTSSGGSAVAMRRKNMRRLCEVVVWEEELSRRVTQQSFLVVWLEGGDQRIHLAVNHRLASALFVGGRYARVLMSERLALNEDLPMHVHAFLSTCVSAGHQLVLGLSTLAARVWPMNHDTAPEGTIRRRKSELLAALRAIGRLPSWSVTHQAGSELVTVYRRSQGVRQMPSAVASRTSTSYAEQAVTEDACHTPHLSRAPDVSGLFSKS